MNRDQLKELVIIPALMKLREYNAKMYSKDAAELMVNIVAHESKGGEYIKQLGAGPALSIFQIEPATHRDVWENFINNRGVLKEVILGMASLNFYRDDESFDEELIFNLRYAAAIARILLWRDKGALPSEHDLEGQADYWKRVYNTNEGKGTTQRFILDAKEYS